VAVHAAFRARAQQPHGWLLVAGAIALSCASRPPPAATPIEVAHETLPDAASPTCEALATPGVLERSALRRAVDGGLGRWLGGVDVEAARDAGRFSGWRIRSLYPGDPCYGQIDLRPGDVVTRINGAALERPEQANALFVSLPAASALTIEYLRDAAPRSFTLTIRGE
jgi:S1-C subfamily serine protease